MLLSVIIYLFICLSFSFQNNHALIGANRVYGHGVLLLTCVAVGNVYPVIDSDQKALYGKPNYQNYDAHFASVVPRNPSDPHEKYVAVLFCHEH